MLSGRILQEFCLVWLDENDSVCRDDIAVRFIHRNSASSDLVAVLFMIRTDLSTQTTSFTNITNSSAVKKEEEILSN